ncbi:MAG: hypothetical protein WA094_07995 [Candidatus Desulfobacillus denitrificans]|nr:hypothetical protein [Bacteroidia bacterium]
MNTVSMLYRLDHPPIERVVLPPSPSITDEVQVVEHDIEEITLPVPDWDDGLTPTIH